MGNLNKESGMGNNSLVDNLDLREKVLFSYRDDWEKFVLEDF